jgi:hypothetical protein
MFEHGMKNPMNIRVRRASMILGTIKVRDITGRGPFKIEKNDSQQES